MLYPLSYGPSGLPGKDASVRLRACSMRRPASGRDAAARLGLAIARAATPRPALRIATPA